MKDAHVLNIKGTNSTRNDITLMLARRKVRSKKIRASKSDGSRRTGKERYQGLEVKMLNKQSFDKCHHL